MRLSDIKWPILKGILLGGLCFIYPILLFIILLIALLIWFLNRQDPAIRERLTKIVVLGLGLRVIMIGIAIVYLSFLNINLKDYPVLKRVIGNSTKLFRDFDREVKNGINISNYLSGEFGDISWEKAKAIVPYERLRTYLNTGSYFQGGIYYIFGHSPFNLLIFPFLGIWAVILTYLVGRELFHPSVASLAAAMVALMPSFVIWSCINFRMTISITSLLMMTWASILFGKRNHLKYILIFIIGFFLLKLGKAKFADTFLVICPLIFFLSWNISPQIKKICLCVLTIIGGFLILNHPGIQSKFNRIEQNIIQNQKSFSEALDGNQAHKHYKTYNKIFYTSDVHKLKNISPLHFLKALPKGLAYFMLAPFPWRINTTIKLIYYPQMLLVYFMLPFCLIGIGLGLRYCSRETAITLIIFLFWSLILSLVLGNEATAARQRDLVLPYFFIFAGAGLCHVLKQPRVMMFINPTTR